MNLRDDNICFFWDAFPKTAYHAFISWSRASELWCEIIVWLHVKVSDIERKGRKVIFQKWENEQKIQMENEREMKFDQFVIKRETLYLALK